MALKKEQRRQRIQYRIRKKINGSTERPRISVFRSNKEIYAQLIDDTTGVTIMSVSSTSLTSSAENKTDAANKVGKLLAEKALANNISSVVFDRSGYLYHGRIKALAEGAREGGLKF